MIRSLMLLCFMSLFGGAAYCQHLNLDTLQLNAYLKAHHDHNQFDGIALIASNDSIIYYSSFGYANRENRTPFDLSTKFQIASLSKQFTAFGILILEQDHQLKTEDYVYQYLPKFPYKNIKIRHLMSHTSGLPNFVTTMWKDLDTTKVNGNRDMLKLLESHQYPLQWSPGTKWEYSDIGYCTLAILIEEVSGLNFKQFMRERLFHPAGMSRSSAELSTDYRTIKSPGLAMGYVYDPVTLERQIAYESPENSFIFWLGGFYGDGSVVSTVEDLLKWDKALYAGTIISPESLRKATTPTTLSDGNLVSAWGTSYGWGWFLENSEQFGLVQSHSGGHPGYSSRMTRLPEKNLTIIILSNLSIPEFSKLNILKELEKQN